MNTIIAQAIWLTKLVSTNSLKASK
jgi:hypothetical protein